MKRNGTYEDRPLTSPVPSPALPEMAGALCVVLVTSLITNSLVIVVFSLRPVLLTLSNRFVLNGIISNVLMTVIIMPCIVISMATGTWLLGDMMCQASGFLFNVFVGAGNLSLVTVSIDRYFAIRSPLRYKVRVTPSRCTASIMAVWMLSVCVSVPPLLGWSEIAFHEEMMLCTVNSFSEQFISRYYSILVLVLFYLIPLATMLVVYVFIFCAARGNSERARRNSVLPAPRDEESSRTERRGSGSISTLRRLSAGTLYIGQQIAQAQGWKAAVTSLLVLLSFLMCWTPYFVLIVCQSLSTNFETTLGTGAAAVFMVTLSCPTTPIVYVFRSRTIRNVLMQLLRRETVVQELSAGRTESRRPSDVSEIQSSSLGDAATSRQFQTQTSSITLPGMSTS